VKGTSLLGLSLPYACYASEELVRWARGPRARALVAAGLAVLAVCVAAGTTFEGLFPRPALPGLTWEGAPR